MGVQSREEKIPFVGMRATRMQIQGEQVSKKTPRGKQTNGKPFLVSYLSEYFTRILRSYFVQHDMPKSGFLHGIVGPKRFCSKMREQKDA